MPMNAADRAELAAKLQVVFKPATPITINDIFAGRQAQLSSTVSAINQNGRHVIIYGERAVGKTSLTNILRYNLYYPGRILLNVAFNCRSGDTFKSIWTRAFFKLHEQMSANGIAPPRSCMRYFKLVRDGFDDFLTPEIIEKILVEVSSLAILIIVIDEFDTLDDPLTRRSVADSIKSLSDRNVPVSIVLVGVSDDVEGLIRDHESIERCLTQVPMPRMERDEIESIVKKCLTVVEMEIEAAGLHEISRIAKGLPHYAHLLGLYAGLTAAASGEKHVTQAHVDKAIPIALQDNTQATIQKAYQKATISSRSNATFRHLLAACAMAQTDDFGYFSPSDLVKPLGVIFGRDAKIESFNRNLHAFSEEEFGRVLKKTMIRNRPRFRFANSMMAPYALMRGMSEGFVDEKSLKATRDDNDPQGKLF